MNLDNRYKELYEQKAIIEQEMSEIKQQIVEQAIAEPDTMFNGLTVYKIKGRKSIAWKAIAEMYEPPEALIEANTKIGEPSFGIKVQKVEETN